MTRTKSLSEVKPLFLYVIVDITTGLPHGGFCWSRREATSVLKMVPAPEAAKYRVRRAKVFVYNK